MPEVPEPYPVAEAEAAYAARLGQLLDAEWTELAEALQRLETAGVFGSWTQARQQADGSWQLPYTTLSEESEDFLATLGRLGLYLPFDWTAWERGRLLARDPALLEQASPAEAAMLILAVRRSDRFVEGDLLAALESGLIQRAARRVLAASAAAGGAG